MTLLSRKADYALLILSHLYSNRESVVPVLEESVSDCESLTSLSSAADRTQVMTARAIADRFGLSRAFVANILKELCQSGYVTSSRGVKGGYALLRSAKQVTVAELLESIDESFQFTLCNGHHNSEIDVCNVEQICPMKGPISEIHQRLMEVLRSVTLAELFEPHRTKASVRLLPLATLPSTSFRTNEVCGETRAATAESAPAS